MKNILTFVLIWSCLGMCVAQDFMLQGWYWDYPKTCNGFTWADTLKDKAGLLQNNFTHVWLPPLSRASFGDCSNGYDPQDLYDLGEYGQGATGFGTRTDVNEAISALGGLSIDVIADVVYNHRDGGLPEQNDPVKDYITTHYSANKNPFPSDRFRCVIPIGGSSGNNAGSYYFKVNSKTADGKFYNKPYRIYVETNTVGWQGLPDLSESEPNCNSDCDPAGCSGNPPGSVSSTTITLGRNYNASVDNTLPCNTDEFFLDLNVGDFDPNGDFLYIYLTNYTGDYSDHRIWGLWRHNDGAQNGENIVNELVYQTYTDFTSLPSGQGGMNYENFRPNSTNAATTWLAGDWDWLWFFYDVDQERTATQDVYTEWTKWLWNDVGIRGYRMDAVKHFPESFVGTLMDNLSANSINPEIVVGEYFDTDPSKLLGWVNAVLSNMSSSSVNIRAFDFALRQSLKNACDAFGYDVRNVFNSGMVDLAGASGLNVITFVNNHDYRHGGEPVQNDPMLAYAYILTNNQVGLPCVFYPEYFGKAVPNYPNVNLRTQINELIQIHKNYIYLSDKKDYLSRIGTGYFADYNPNNLPPDTYGTETTTLFFQLANGIAGKDILVAINFAGVDLDVVHQINGDLDGDGTNLPIGTQFIEQTNNSNSPTLTLSNTYRVNVKVPARSYAIWAQGAALPVELINFSAMGQNGQVRLDWESAAEVDFAGYHIERSRDGKSFESLDWIPAQGKETTSATYQYFDKSPIRGEVLYYRLKLLDLDGSFTYSPVRTAKVEKEWGLPLIMPNPTNGNTLLSFKAPTEEIVSLYLFDAMGHQKMENEIPAVKGLNSMELNLQGLTAGIYYLQLTENGVVRWREKVVKF